MLILDTLKKTSKIVPKTGTEPTVTDAHLILGRIPAALLGGDQDVALETFTRRATRGAHGTEGAHWSYARDLGPAWLAMVDSRDGRVLTGGQRHLLDGDEGFDKEWGGTPVDLGEFAPPERDMPDAERKNETVQLRFAPRIDRRKELLDRDLAPAFLVLELLEAARIARFKREDVGGLHDGYRSDVEALRGKACKGAHGLVDVGRLTVIFFIILAELDLQGVFLVRSVEKIQYSSGEHRR